MKISEALEKAADIQERFGHCKSIWEDAEGRHCVQGSIAVAVGQPLEPLDGEMIIPTVVSDLYTQTNKALGDYLVESGIFPFHNTYTFNDDPETEGTDVVRALREASAWQREREELDAPVQALAEEEVTA